MIDCEPNIKVALLQQYCESEITFNGNYYLPDGRKAEKILRMQSSAGKILLSDISGRKIALRKKIYLTADKDSTFTLDVKIGIGFHWQRVYRLTFHGSIILRVNPDSSFNLINELPLEEYLTSVISSEMSANAPLEFLKAQAITARSWLVAMLMRKKRNANALRIDQTDDNEIIRWHDTNDHSFFDVCADDHCQRYQGIAPVTSDGVKMAIQATRGIYLVYGNKVCDARYYKACGGRSEVFSSAWEDKSFPYLQSVADSAVDYAAISSEDEAARWLKERPDSYCNTQDESLLRQILPSFDQETMNFYRWQVSYTREELEEIIRKKSGIDFGTLQSLTAVKRGPSGRINKLKIEGTKRTIIVGKELEIRSWLSPTHLLSSAFVVTSERSKNGAIKRFTLHGGGWGHGVGLCQIGAAVMAAKGFSAEDILAHYFSGAKLQKLY